MLSQLVAICAVACLQPIYFVNALSTPQAPDIINRQFIQLTNPINSGFKQSLPVSFIQDWPTWVLDEEGKLSRIPDGDGFVQPTSVDEIWHPIDLKRPAVKLAMGLHVREGTIRHVMPAIDLSYDGGAHRNRGMCSVPRAHSWIDFSLSMDEWENYKIMMFAKDTKDDKSWENLKVSPIGEIPRAIERATVCLSEDAPDEMGTGSHILHVILSDESNTESQLDCPRHALRVTMDDEEVSSANAAEEASGVLDVVVSSTIAGVESEFLPDAYRPLFDDTALQNPLYAKYKQRQRLREENR
ncbi:unnamed protein product [Cylindrotheca closterium]|uniref:Uncharacterized protein n=1 Tax=Cylindrotheca closterium TaxID=2856 RepID=A0AAD2FQQ2_9STRA|nr:unnamed protein product [Cylindrotheca closterium]